MKPIVREYLEALIVAILLALIVRVFALTAYIMPSNSMSPSILTDDVFLSYRLPYGFWLPFGKRIQWSFYKPERGSVIIYVPTWSNAADLRLARIYATEGDLVETKENFLWINGKKTIRLASKNQTAPNQSLSGSPSLESHSGESSNSLPSRLVVPPSQVLALSDQPDSSLDPQNSDLGLIPIHQIESQAFLILFSRNPNKGNSRNFSWIKKELSL